MLMIFIRDRILWHRWISLISVAACAGITGYLIRIIQLQGVQTLHVGGWSAPFGISLVADMLSALLVFTALIVSFACLLYMFGSMSKAHEHFFLYPFVQILICGVNGSFLTGDIFNLFVFFEVMLIASYVLLGLGGKRRQLKETLQYVLINMTSSTLFVAALAYLYSAAGTLNMAHLSERMAEAGQSGPMTVISILLLIVFSIKAALFLFFWLPGSYSAPPAAIAALFAALLTKVGVYAILRVFTLIFTHQPQVTHTIMIWMGAATMILGAFGVVAYKTIRPILAYNVIISVGFMLFGVGIASQTALSGTVYYLVHDMIAKALIFILGGAMISIAGTDRLPDMKGLIHYRPLLGWLFFLAGLALAGVPPLSGFVGKVMILEGGIRQENLTVTIIGLISSLFVLYSMMKIFVQGFWGETFLSEGEQHDTGKSALLPGAILAALAVGMGLGAEWVLEYVDLAVEPMLNPEIYIRAVLNTD
jgi:multicomponent Na+:H+ antiporter subunit D